MTGVPAGIKNISLSAVSPSKSNPRLSIDPVALDGLVESIKAVGLQNPILLRPDADGYEIVAGHRRYAAFEKLGEEEIPAIVREMTDDECREVQLVDNLQRADLDPLEECAAYASLRERHGTATAIAQRVGKTTAHVTRVLQLQNLTFFAKKALDAKLIGFDHALLLAKVGWEEQEQALKYLVDPWGRSPKKPVEEVVAKAIERRQEDATMALEYWDPPTPAKLRSWIEGNLELELGSAPWPLDDAAMLPDAGACTSCPKNTAANEALFGDLVIEEARCTDAHCFRDKREAYVQIQLAAVPRIGGKEPVRISWAYSEKKPKWLKDGSGPKPDQVFKYGQWVESKEGCDHVVQGVAVDYDRSYRRDAEKKPGIVLRVCVASGCKRHPKAWEQLAKKSSSSSRDRADEEEKLNANIAACKQENALRLKLANEALKGVKKLPEAVIRAALQRLAPWNFRSISPEWNKALENAAIGSRGFTQAACAAWLSQIGLEVSEYGYTNPHDGRRNFQNALKQLGYDASRAWKKQSSNSEGKEAAEKRQSSRKGASAKPRPPAKKAKPKKSPAKKSATPNPRKKAAAKKPLPAKKSPKKGASK